VEVSQERTSYVLAQSALVTARYNLALQSIQMKYYLGEIRRGQIQDEESHGRETPPPSNPPPSSPPPP
jgi:outer membrane protein TolC